MPVYWNHFLFGLINCACKWMHIGDSRDIFGFQHSHPHWKYPYQLSFQGHTIKVVIFCLNKESCQDTLRFNCALRDFECSFYQMPTWNWNSNQRIESIAPDVTKTGNSFLQRKWKVGYLSQFSWEPPSPSCSTWEPLRQPSPQIPLTAAWWWSEMSSK